ncbi:hypothetical protein GA0074695_4730 [Micromonospora viridifaciens]|uniref:Uncharacterized protein n=1 Tax=Micromonospora viridifaciens TaxID=1881 RepID=A0A1C4YV37_MICVI|nr:hypothetical protein GA0074695_4730 [Micromonospora viridifaciens]
MPHPDEPALVAYVAEHSSATALAVYDATDPAAAFAALQAAAAEISQIRHPDEPDTALPNWCAVLDDDGVPVLHLDMKDEIRYAALVVRIVLDQLAGGGVDGRLAPKREPESPFPRDPRAARYEGMDPLTELDRRGLPPGFPAGFPLPEQATLVLAERSRNGAVEHAAWRRSTGPFTGYLDQLRAYGCTFGAVPRLLTVGDPGNVQYTLWRDGAGGTVTLYQSSAARLPRSPLYWYVSIIWQPQAEPPAAAVEPDEAPDTRPVPTGPAAARELAEFLVPPQLVLGYETVMAVATAARAMDGLVKAPPDPADRRPEPAVIASRFTSLLDRLDHDQLSTVRHVCLAMVANLLANGRRPRPNGLTLVADEDGYLYAADLREGVQDAVDLEHLPAFETGAVLVQSAPMITEALSGIRSAPAPPPTDRYAWLFASLAPQHLAAARDACWQILDE